MAAASWGGRLMKDKMIIFLTIWFAIVLVGLLICSFMGKISTGSYYISMTNCGIWLTLLNMYIDKE